MIKKRGHRDFIWFVVLALSAVGSSITVASPAEPFIVEISADNQFGCRTWETFDHISDLWYRPNLEYSGLLLAKTGGQEAGIAPLNEGLASGDCTKWIRGETASWGDWDWKYDKKTKMAQCLARPSSPETCYWTLVDATKIPEWLARKNKEAADAVRTAEETFRLAGAPSKREADATIAAFPHETILESNGEFGCRTWEIVHRAFAIEGPDGKPSHTVDDGYVHDAVVRGDCIFWHRGERVTITNAVIANLGNKDEPPYNDWVLCLERKTTPGVCYWSRKWVVDGGYRTPRN